MPTIRYVATGRRSGDTLNLRVEFADGRTLARTVTWSKVDSADKLAAWLLEQQPDAGDAEPTLQRGFTVTYHTAQVPGADGQPATVKVIDSVVPAALVEDDAWAALADSQLGRVTLAEALAAVDGAQTLAQVKAILRALVQVVIPMRDVVDRLLTLLRRMGLR